MPDKDEFDLAQLRDDPALRVIDASHALRRDDAGRDLFSFGPRRGRPFTGRRDRLRTLSWPRFGFVLLDGTEGGASVDRAGRREHGRPGVCRPELRAVPRSDGTPDVADPRQESGNPVLLRTGRTRRPSGATSAPRCRVAA